MANGKMDSVLRRNDTRVCALSTLSARDGGQKQKGGFWKIQNPPLPCFCLKLNLYSF
ncbi:MAG: hypothetical protein LBH29_00125 [Elusimicrobiota bacterium]|nr:hypothetical protein [Elusimicrobiota bacterium]